MSPVELYLAYLRWRRGIDMVLPYVERAVEHAKLEWARREDSTIEELEHELERAMKGQRWAPAAPGEFDYERYWGITPAQ